MADLNPETMTLLVDALEELRAGQARIESKVDTALENMNERLQKNEQDIDRFKTLGKAISTAAGFIATIIATNWTAFKQFLK